MDGPTGDPPSPAPIEERVPPQAYSFLSVWRALGEICPLNGCYLPKLPGGSYCSDTHASMARRVPSNGKAAEVFGGFSSVDEVENSCCKALLNHHRKLDVGIPILSDTISLFNTHPDQMPRVFTPRPHSSSYLFFAQPPSRFRKMRKITDENPRALKWYVKDTFSIVLTGGPAASDVRVVDVDVEGIDGEILVKTLKLTRKDLHPWDLFHFQYKDQNLCCLTFRSVGELKLVRLPKNKKEAKDNELEIAKKPREEKKKVRYIRSDTLALGPIVRIPNR